MKGLKIEKLFHWLYAILMLLPIFAIGVSCAYVVFNKNAYLSYSDRYTNETYNFNNTNQLIDNREFVVTYEQQNNTFSNIFGFKNISVDLSSITNSDYEFNCLNFLDNRIQFRVYDNITGEYSNLFTLSVIQYPQLQNFTFTSNGFYQHNGNSWNNFGFNIQFFEYTQIKLDNVFYYSVDMIKENPLFSWASNSFLSAPLLFITNLFLMPSNSAIITLMCYWFNISIIWMVFDIMIYVPRLAHKWLDKGI